MGHGLILQRIHSAEAADGLLVQLDCLLTFGAKVIFCIQSF
jgi:hypothetical protein